jgi:hypothetical protein
MEHKDMGARLADMIVSSNLRNAEILPAIDGHDPAKMLTVEQPT